ncbi:ADP-ribose pyrophosphatase YjhB, NUDIX family [Paramicrobacterium humi]|uniref:ADP-ribose pyrophosphatase YjhB, NUDIX family n=1 Tax=Paramicrobacterium humi TaxID=640635 RepID=A0A1H4MFY0_9MICO|nr:NUDIX domain-containing protein [Microbacterium humi]SEB81833.1 ADP-ribose pyrophosphatase YjhB, NUDIX family [Microbacterium humi]
MPTPEFIVGMREKIGHDELWLSGVTAVVSRKTDAGTEVLLGRRADNGSWTNITGIIDPGEEPAVAAEREVLEEAGIVAVAERLVWVHALPKMAWGNGDKAQFLDIAFACRYVSGEPEPVDGENSAVAWFPIDALPALAEDHAERIRVALSGEERARFER